MADKEIGILDHLEELRYRFIIIISALFITTCISYFFAYKILSFIKIPAGNIILVYLSPFEPFMIRLKIALFSGIMLSLPIILYQTLAFLVPGLKKNEKRTLFLILFVFIVLFIMGAYFSFVFLLPISLKWLFAQANGYLTSNIRADYYIMFVGWFVLISGLVFETPLLIISLLKLKICTYKSLRKQWQIIYIGILVASAILTPDWNPITMLLMAIPILFLYEASLLIGRLLA
ncbi:MAG: twin-arginine translocase subunit TatC [bacterium]